MLTFERVTATMDRGAGPVPVLRDISLELTAGRVTGILESSAEIGGRSLLEIAARERRPDKGEVTFEGRDLFARRGPRPLILTWFRHQVLPEHRVLTLVSACAERHVRGRMARFQALAALEWAGVRKLAGAWTTQISSTECASVWLACVFAARPQLIVAEDPVMGFGGMRNATLARLRRLAESRAMAALLLSPRPTDLVFCHERLKLSDGRLAPTSAPLELVGRPRPGDPPRGGR